MVNALPWHPRAHISYARADAPPCELGRLRSQTQSTHTVSAAALIDIRPRPRVCGRPTGPSPSSPSAPDCAPQEGSAASEVRGHCLSFSTPMTSPPHSNIASSAWLISTLSMSSSRPPHSPGGGTRYTSVSKLMSQNVAARGAYTRQPYKKLY